MSGGLGNDTLYVNAAGDVTIEAVNAGLDTVFSSISRTLGANFEKLTLFGAAAINGAGNALNNTLVGNAAANVLNGMAGIDTMVGGAGNDIYFVDNPADSTTETGLADGYDTVVSTVARVLGDYLEKLILSGTAAINGYGNALDNSIIGNAANNVLYGYAGNDSLNGGTGNDILYGNIGNDTLNGGAGIDTMVGGTGNDTYFVDTPRISPRKQALRTDTIQWFRRSPAAWEIIWKSWFLPAPPQSTATATHSTTPIVGNTANNALYGYAGNDFLFGSAGNDVLNGGAGNDTMTGGTGLDTFVFDNILNAATNKDSITDFTAVERYRHARPDGVQQAHCAWNTVCRLFSIFTHWRSR